MNSRAIVFTGPLQAELVEQDLPEPGPGEITQQTTVSLVSTGTELICLRGECDADTHWQQYTAFPHRPGYSSVGRVVRLGEEVTELQAGDRVCTTASHRQFANVSPGQVWCARIPEGISDEQAAWASLAVITQTGVRQAEHVMGDRAVVVGLGPLGQLVAQYLRALGLQEVLVVDPVQDRVDTALAHGATAGFCGEVAGAGDFVLEHTEGDRADVVYDVTGHYAVLAPSLRLARDFGKLILIGDSPFPSRQHLTDDVLSRQVQIIGSRSCWLPPKHAYWTPQRQVDLFFTYLQRGQMRVTDLITHRFPPEQAPQVYQMLLENRTATLGVLFDWGGR